MTKTIEEFWNFDEADLAANRLNRLTEKQKKQLSEMAQKHKSFNTMIGVIVALVFCGPLLVGLPTTLAGSFGNMIFGDLLEDGKFSLASLAPILPFICMALFFIIVFGGVMVMVLRVIYERANKKVDTTVHRAEGKVNFIWVETQERNTSKTGPMYKTVRVLELRMGGDTFTVNNELPDVINQGEEWIIYYTNHPFKFLSGEKVK